MKKLLLSTVALVGLSAGAIAADLPARVAPPPPIAAIPVFTWTGFYFGVNAGGAFTDNESNRGRLVTNAPGGPNRAVRSLGGGGGGNNNFFRNSEDGGFTGGGQIGYNMQFGSFVAGIEADAQFIDLGNRGGIENGIRTARLIPGAIAPPVVGSGGNVLLRGNGVSELDFFGTVRGRLGYAFDRTMIYGTGGFAYSFLDNEVDGGRANQGGFFVGRARNRGNNRVQDGDDLFGYTVGGGVEYAFTNNISVKLEGLYVDLDEEGNGQRRSVGVTNLGRSIRLANRNNDDTYGEFAVIRAGLNVRFGTW